MSADWREQAVCRADPHLFFGADDEEQRDRLERVERALAVCAGCPVRQPCREFAHALSVGWGVWAGEDREAARPAPEDPPALCGNGLHLMTPDNSKPIAGTAQVRCRECQRESDRHTRSARHARRRQRIREQRRAA